jgi:integrase/recombinase XerC
MGWAVEAVADYVENIRPKFGCDGHPALWVTERGGRIRPPEINARFEAYRDALGLPSALVVHSLRHAVTTMLDAGVDLRDVQIAARHADPRTTMRYDRARQNLGRHPNYILAAFMASGT